MKIFSKQDLLRRMMIVISLITTSFILWNTYQFFQKFKEEERLKMENFAQAQIELGKIIDINGNISGFPLKIIQSNSSTPMIIEDSEGNFQSKNIELKSENVQEQLMFLSKKFREENKPIDVIYNGNTLSTLYYGDSELLNKLKYYPFALLLILFLFSAVILLYYKSTQVASQNKLWTGMAKETAHQIGTPLSSLIGWAELLKSENINPDYIFEIEKDIQRLEIITDRFSKIGSKPVLKTRDIIEATIESFNYLKLRSSKLISFEIKTPEIEILVPLNLELFSWTIENLVVNGIDSMKGKGHITVFLTSTEKTVLINVTDSGKGIKNNLFKKVFETGFTSKKRGWGLGLSLAKRIIEDYHNGKIKVLKSEIDVGTTIQISLKRL